MALTSSNVQKFVEENNIVYPVGIGGPNARNYGVKGIPAVYLIAPSGKVVWEGHTNGLTDARIEEQLQKVVLFPQRDWPGKVSSPAKLAKKGKLGDAWRKLEKLSDLEGDEAEAADALRKYIDGQASMVLDNVDSLIGDEDYYGANNELNKHKKSFKGHPAEEKIKSTLDDFGKTDAIQKSIKAGKYFAIGQELQARKEIKSALGAYMKAAKVGEGTKVGERAQAKVENLQAELGF